MNRFLSVALLFLSILVTACSKPVSTVSGIFDADMVNVSSECSGKILQFYVNQGDIVSEGQELALVDTIAFEVQINNLLAAKAAAKVAVQDASVQTKALNEQLVSLESDRNRISRLIEVGAASRHQLEQIETSIAVIRSQIDAAQASILTANNASRENVTSIETQIKGVLEMKEKCHIRSSTGGTVIGKYAQAGEIVAVGHPILRIADMDNVFLKAYLKSSQLQNVRLGQKMKVIAKFGEDSFREYNGVVTWISSESEFVPKSIPTDKERSNLVYQVKIAVKNDGYIKLGLTGDAVLPDE